MNKRERVTLRELTEQLNGVTRGAIPPDGPFSPELQEFIPLADSIRHLGLLLADARQFISALSRGDLDAAPPPHNPLIAPFKQMHANLRHLTWQTRQIAAGDLDQHVDFLGAFSVAFNSMIEALREKRVADEKIRYLSMHDTLTDLYNRGYFEEEMARIELGRSFPVSILMADLDGLKKINDTQGHAAGDMLIKDAAKILGQAVRASDVEFLPIAQLLEIGADALELQQAYIVEGILAEKWYDDALHVALASVTECDVIVSWNFKHIVNFREIPLFNAVNVLKGYRHIAIHSPLEVIDYEE